MPLKCSHRPQAICHSLVISAVSLLSFFPSYHQPFFKEKAPPMVSLLLDKTLDIEQNFQQSYLSSIEGTAI
jgi:hypothetical protein